MLRRFALEQDVARRVDAAKALMEEKGLGAILIPARGAPGMMGMAQYFTNLNLWAGPAWVVLTADDPEPALLIWSSYGAEWNRQEATTSWVENPDPDTYGRVLEIVAGATTKLKRVGIEHIPTHWTVGDMERAKAELDGREFVDITKELDAMRSIKSHFEIEHFYDLGRMTKEAFDIFEQVARPGVRAWEAASAAEEHLRANGCIWGRSKYSMDLRPYTIPTTVDRELTQDDKILFELVYASELGYWLEMTAFYTFEPLDAELQAQIDAHEKVIEACAYELRDGNPIGRISEVSNATWEELGFEVQTEPFPSGAPPGKHTPNCHSIGLDESDGPSSWFTPSELLKTNMVISFHPSTRLKGDRAFLVSDNYLVTQNGGVRLSPLNWTHKVIGN